jgi:hypothetical protein
LLCGKGSRHLSFSGELNYSETYSDHYPYLIKRLPNKRYFSTTEKEAGNVAIGYRVKGDLGPKSLASCILLHRFSR